MKFSKLFFVGATLLLSSPLFATTYMGGVEDWASPSSDYDYNDVVFSLSGTNLTLHTATGQWFNQPAVGTMNKSAGAMVSSATPFWNNPSLDGSGGYNVGFCIYGGGACNKGVGLAPSDQYLATSTGGSVGDVYFSVNGAVSESVSLSITAATDSLGWQLTSGGPIHWLGTGVQGPVSFTTTGDFILLAQNSGTSQTFSSNAMASDGVSHFAFFGTPTPEPASLGMLGMALIGGLALRKRFAA